MAVSRMIRTSLMVALVPDVDVALAHCPGVLRWRVGEGPPGHAEQ